ncbi:MAG: Uma2 family endonuclease [Actinomycetales bacterium]|nr:Uma2 family endonuclease [Candidatus Phosphoribacter baldrii]
MGAMTVLARTGEFTREDLVAMPDDGHRHELLDGTIVVTPSPGLRHQRMSLALAVLLVNACPEGLQVLTAPFDVVLSPRTLVVPDLLVARRGDFTDKDLPRAPLLAVEILSPSTRRIDLTLKRDLYAEAGTAAYWVLDPAVPSITTWALRAGTFEQTGYAAGPDSLSTDLPFPVTICPGDLLR